LFPASWRRSPGVVGAAWPRAAASGAPASSQRSETLATSCHVWQDTNSPPPTKQPATPTPKGLLLRRFFSLFSISFRSVPFGAKLAACVRPHAGRSVALERRPEVWPAAMASLVVRGRPPLLGAAAAAAAAGGSTQPNRTRWAARSNSIYPNDDHEDDERGRRRRQTQTQRRQARGFRWLWLESFNCLHLRSARLGGGGAGRAELASFFAPCELMFWLLVTSFGLRSIGLSSEPASACRSCGLG